ncbi:uncharacterized protein C5L36_0D03625 [Pichia kudriavzevii]|uniref:Uncharacterized protein n=1 Tax=Pichia kudriavzevii TaxID=4909 RepID=A0A2U9R9R6_PICKU|nr:uncharacterized protein C5L36_0D03625 [Pichia kudriavzevii]AWU77629.1 hypothetical protein C5L36_0D03625 [Pichia kudriavzevii]
MSSQSVAISEDCIRVVNEDLVGNLAGDLDSMTIKEEQLETARDESKSVCPSANGKGVENLRDNKGVAPSANEDVYKKSKRKFSRKKHLKKKRTISINLTNSNDTNEAPAKVNVSNKIQEDKGKVDQKVLSLVEDSVEDEETVKDAATSKKITKEKKSKGKKRFNWKKQTIFPYNGRIINGIIYPDNSPILLSRSFSGSTFTRKNSNFIPVNSNHMALPYESALDVVPEHSYRNNINVRLPSFNGVFHYKPKEKNPTNPNYSLGMNECYYGRNPFPNVQNYESIKPRDAEGEKVLEKLQIDATEKNKIDSITLSLTQDNTSSTSINTITAN